MSAVFSFINIVYLLFSCYNYTNVINKVILVKIEDIKKTNTSKILNGLRINNNISKKDLSDIIKLSPSTVTEICAVLTEQNIIKELGAVNSDKPGRKKILLSINYDYKKIIGIDIKRNLFTISLTNLKGNIIFQQTIKTDTSEPYIFTEFLCESIKTLIKENSLKKNDILGIGISIVGVVDAKNKATMSFIGFWNEAVPLGKIIEEKIEIPVFLNNNVKNLAIYQMFANNTLSDFFLLKYGTGVGGSLVIQKQLFKNETPMSGEIGHSIVTDSEEICPVCKRKGCFEYNFSEAAIIKKIKKIFSKSETPILFSMVSGKIEKISFKKILKAGEQGEIAVLKLFEQAADNLSIIILNMFTLFYPEKIILCGEIFKNEVFLNYFFGFIHKKQIFDFKKIICISSISAEEEKTAPVFSVLKEKFYMI